MGYPDGYYYGQGRIICDTSTFSVGDTIRVRSMTDSSKVWNQQVATVGTALVFTVPCYDYYKICTVQDIGGTPTEIGGVYKTVDYGQTIYVDVLNKNSLQGIQGILNSHTENYALNIGDEATIKINDGGTPKDWAMQIAAINPYNQHEVYLASKEIHNLSIFTSGTGVMYNSTGYDSLRQKMLEFYNSIDNKDKVFIKDTPRTCRQEGYDNWILFSDKVFPLNRKEIDGTQAGGGTPQTSIIQFPLFTTQAQRIKKYNGSSQAWWTCDGNTGNTAWFVGGDGAVAGGYGVNTANFGVVPCFRLTADS